MMAEFQVDATDFMGFYVGKRVLVNIHDPEACEGQGCVIHHPSDHHMKDWPLLFRSDKGLMERTCEHGTGHPDPDSLAWHISQGREYMGVHGCDSCCMEPFSAGDHIGAFNDT